MKKLANLSAVAVLAAFGWGNVVYADHFGDPFPYCNVVNLNPGLDLDYINVFWDDLGADGYSIAVVCMDPDTGRSKSAKLEVGAVAPGLPVFLMEFIGWRSLKIGDVCMVAVKGLHTDGTPNNSVVGKADCAGELVD